MGPFNFYAYPDRRHSSGAEPSAAVALITLPIFRPRGDEFARFVRRLGRPGAAPNPSRRALSLGSAAGVDLPVVLIDHRGRQFRGAPIP